MRFQNIDKFAFLFGIYTVALVEVLNMVSPAFEIGSNELFSFMAFVNFVLIGVPFFFVIRGTKEEHMKLVSQLKRFGLAALGCLLAAGLANAI